MAVLLSACFLQAVVFASLQATDAKVIEYCIGALDVTWDYAPSGINLKTGVKLDDDEDASVFTKKSNDRIGKVYKKTIYREFTNGSFTEQKVHRKDLGILGPIIQGEVGDIFRITFKNMAKRPFSMHPHGVSYSKNSEGAIYNDFTSKELKRDDAVQPGKTHVYQWKINPDNGPAKGDQSCVPSVYHSHIVVPRDINTGLIGLMLACKKGTLREDRKTRTDVDKEVFLLQSVFDENKSWHLDENLKINGIDPAGINKEDESFVESNLMHAINGRFFGNLEGLDVCYGTKVAWYLGALGNEVDMHTAAFTGNLVEIDHHKTDVTSLFPATTASATMMPKNLGRWLFSCQVADHLSGGMFSFYNVKKCMYSGKAERPRVTGALREFNIAVVEEPWAYAVSDENKFDGGRLANGESSGAFFDRSYNRIGGTYIKAMFVEYTDSSFVTKKQRTSNEKHLGFMGPVIKAEVGDVIRVVFQNKATRAYSIHPRGVWYDKSNEGYMYDDQTKSSKKYDDAVYPGSQYTYEWFVPDEMSPTDQDPPCVARLYSSTVDPVKDMYSGLIGPLVICKKGSLQSSGIPKGYDSERYVLMGVIDENKSWYLDQSMNRFCYVPGCFNIDKENPDFVESNKMHQVNGRMYGHLEGLNFCQGNKILWHTLVVGTETDIHAIYFHGNDFEINGNHKDALTLFPGASASFTMVANNVGKWALECKVNDHYMAGMKALYDVASCGSNKTATAETGVERKFFIGIIETDWNYADSNKNILTGDVLDNTDSSKVFTKRGVNRIGKVYKKAVYREFTDESFLHMKARSKDEKHLGVLGPIIRAEEGDKIVIVLKNMASRIYSIHPHGFRYDKRDEGAVYVDGMREPTGAGVSPGKTRTFTWFVPNESAPGPKDSDCITWSYYSAVDTIKDTNTGLIGPLIACRKGTLDAKGKRVDIDEEFALLFTVLDENESWYLKENIDKYALRPDSVNTEDEDFKESNKMHAINGFLFGNGPNDGDYLRMKAGDRVAWYLIGFGNEVDIHTVHFHANDFIHRTNSEHRDNVYNVFPGTFQTVDMIPQQNGTWLLHCHVHDHLEGGMETRYTVFSDQEDTSCKDKFAFCPGIRSRCHNGWVKNNCPKTCKRCGQSARGGFNCFDRMRSCPVWKDLGFCISSRPSFRKHMLKFCAKSCRSDCQ